VYAQQGEVEQALELWKQSLEIEERVGNAQGKAATLHNMAGMYAQQGEVEQALKLFGESLKICERIGDIEGKKSVLENLAYLSTKINNDPQK
jgi:tetratricopeptide (TPR) repeat protein